MSCLSNREYTEQDVGRMLTVLPAAYHLRQEKNRDDKYDLRMAVNTRWKEVSSEEQRASSFPKGNSVLDAFCEHEMRENEKWNADYALPLLGCTSRGIRDEMWFSGSDEQPVGQLVLFLWTMTSTSLNASSSVFAISLTSVNKQFHC